MKIKLAPLFPIALLIIIPLVYIASWGAHLYFPQVNSLLDDEGVRWTVSHPIENFSSVPLGGIILLLMTVSVFIESGLLELCRGGRVSLKQRRALVITSAVMAFVIIIVGIMLFVPQAVVLSPLGSFADSAFAKGAGGILMIVLIILGNVYGFASGRFVTTRDFIYAHRFMIAESASYFVTLFISSQVICSLEYSNLLFFCGDTVMSCMKFAVYYIPLIGVIVRAIKRMP